MAFPSPGYESSSHSTAAKFFTITTAILSIVIVGGAIVLNRDTITLDDVVAMVAPFVIMFFFWLFIMWMRKETGVKWVPWVP
jgi:hypothetical protein